MWLPLYRLRRVLVRFVFCADHFILSMVACFWKLFLPKLCSNMGLADFMNNTVFILMDFLLALIHYFIG